MKRNSASGIAMALALAVSPALAKDFYIYAPTRLSSPSRF
jgi:hypothetical protein